MAEKGKKFDKEKPRWDLLPLDLLEEMVEVLTIGSKKYADENWKIVEDAENRYFAALMRHAVKYQKARKEGKPSIDKETGKSHLASMQCNLLFLTYFENKLKEKLEAEAREELPDKEFRHKTYADKTVEQAMMDTIRDEAGEFEGQEDELVEMTEEDIQKMVEQVMAQMPQ